MPRQCTLRIGSTCEYSVEFNECLVHDKSVHGSTANQAGRQDDVYRIKVVAKQSRQAPDLRW